MNLRMVMVVWNRQSKIFTIASLLAWLIIGCENQKYTQCQEIIAIANKATNQVQKIVDDSSDKEVTFKTWLKAADMMTIAATEIEALPIKDPQLIDYQGNLANIFRVYSQATYDAVKARENKNLSALKIASDNAQKAGKSNQDLVAKINSYCTTQ